MKKFLVMGISFFIATSAYAVKFINVVDDETDVLSSSARRLNKISDVIHDISEGTTSLEIEGYLTDTGATTSGQAVRGRDLEEVDLSGNRLISLLSFEELLLEDQFKYLVVTKNYIGIDAIRDLLTHYGESHKSADEQRKALRKIIWVPEAWLESAYGTLQLHLTYYNIHKNFYDNRRKAAVQTSCGTEVTLGEK